MKVAAFDSKDFKRLKIVMNKREGGFFTPLGIGVIINDSESFEKAYFDAIKRFTESFKMKTPHIVYSSSTLVSELGIPTATAFIQNIIDSVCKHIELVHISYVIIPKNKHTISVCGDHSPAKEIDSQEFLRILSPMFSYISAWNYVRGKKERSLCKLMIDSFVSKETTAWKNLSSWANDISIVTKGDEVNPFISIADLIAFLTDAKLKINKMRLSVETLEEIWKNKFNVEVKYIDEPVIEYIRWRNNEHIDTSKYQLKPTVWYIADDLDTDNVNTEFIQDQQKKIKKGKVLLEMEPVKNAMEYASRISGSFSFYDHHIDQKRITDNELSYTQVINPRKLQVILKIRMNSKLSEQKTRRSC